MLYNAIYILSYTQNIFSVSAEVGWESSVSFDKQVSKCNTGEGNVFEIRKKGRLYYLDSVSSSNNNTTRISEN